MSHHRRDAQHDRPAWPDATSAVRTTATEAPGLSHGLPPATRASDAERDAVGAALRRGAAEGRLTMEGLEQRLGGAYATRTYGELEPLLLADLPDTFLRAASPADILRHPTNEELGARAGGQGPGSRSS